MGTLQKINWRNPAAVLVFFGAVAALLFGGWLLLQHLHDDPPAPVTITIPQEQIDSISAPLIQLFTANLQRLDSTNRRALRDALAEKSYADSNYFLFLQNQTLREETYDRAATASDSELLRIWTDRYDR